MHAFGRVQFQAENAFLEYFLMKNTSSMVWVTIGVIYIQTSDPGIGRYYFLLQLLAAERNPPNWIPGFSLFIVAVCEATEKSRPDHILSKHSTLSTKNDIPFWKNHSSQSDYAPFYMQTQRQMHTYNLQ